MTSKRGSIGTGLGRKGRKKQRAEEQDAIPQRGQEQHKPKAFATFVIHGDVGGCFFWGRLSLFVWC